MYLNFVLSGRIAESYHWIFFSVITLRRSWCAQSCGVSLWYLVAMWWTHAARKPEVQMGSCLVFHWRLASGLRSCKPDYLNTPLVSLWQAPPQTARVHVFICSCPSPQTLWQSVDTTTFWCPWQMWALRRWPRRWFQWAQRSRGARHMCLLLLLKWKGTEMDKWTPPIPDAAVSPIPSCVVPAEGKCVQEERCWQLHGICRSTAIQESRCSKDTSHSKKCCCCNGFFGL